MKVMKGLTGDIKKIKFININYYIIIFKYKIWIISKSKYK